jgi:hypothetical protein
LSAIASQGAPPDTTGDYIRAHTMIGGCAATRHCKTTWRSAATLQDNLAQLCNNHNNSTRNVQRVDMRFAGCIISTMHLRHAAGNTQRSTCNRQHATLKSATWNILDAKGYIPHATRNLQRAALAVPHVKQPRGCCCVCSAALLFGVQFCDHS